MGSLNPRTGCFELWNTTLLDLRFLRRWLLWELHWLDHCQCSFCDETRKSKRKLFIRLPAFKYFFTTGWKTLGFVAQGKAHYLRLA